MAIELFPLLPSGSDQLRPLFATIDYHLAITSILDGMSPGHIFADDQHKPRAAVIWTQQRVFVAGDASHEELRLAVTACLSDRFRQDADERGIESFVLAATPPWSPFLDEIAAAFYPMSGQRNAYERQAAGLPLVLPQSYELRPVNGPLLGRSDLHGQEALLAELISERPSVTDFLMKSFGFAAVREPEILGWCLSEYNTGSRCELGVATAVEHRRQGIATATATATINRAANEGIQRVGWHCWSNNAPSIATARALDFTLRASYPVVFAYIDEQRNLAIHGYMALEEGDAEQALTWLGKAERCGPLPAWALVHMARARAATGEPRLALRIMEEAVRGGFNDFEPLEHDPYLAPLRATAAWTILRGDAGADRPLSES